MSLGYRYYFGWLTLAREGGWRPQGVKCLLDDNILPSWSHEQRQQEIDNFLGYVTPEEAAASDLLDDPEFEPMSRAGLIVELLPQIARWQRKSIFSYCPLPDDSINVIIISQSDCWAMAHATQNRNRWQWLPIQSIVANLWQIAVERSNYTNYSLNSRKSAAPSTLFKRLQPRYYGEEEWIESLRQVGPDGLLVHVC